MAKIVTAMRFIDDLVCDDTLSFVKKKIQMYTVFSLALDFIDHSIALAPDMKTYFTQFVKAYNNFSNDEDIEFSDIGDKKAFELIKKYKLASSEGVNKLVNRMIRYEVLKKVLLNYEKIELANFSNVENAYK